MKSWPGARGWPAVMNFPIASPYAFQAMRLASSLVMATAVVAKARARMKAVEGDMLSKRMRWMLGGWSIGRRNSTLFIFRIHQGFRDTIQNPNYNIALLPTTQLALG